MLSEVTLIKPLIVAKYCYRIRFKIRPIRFSNELYAVGVLKIQVNVLHIFLKDVI